MAESHLREGVTRRQSFRRSISEAGLPDDFLEALDQKRKQLDESIHKYIAAKEREYKHFEKDIRQQFKSSQDRAAAGVAAESRPVSDLSHAESTNHSSAAFSAVAEGGQRQSSPSSSSALVGDGSSSQTSSGHRAHDTDTRHRRASLERDKEFVGLFTPNYLPALGEPKRAEDRRPSSGALSPSNTGNGSGNGEDGSTPADPNALHVGRPLSHHQSNSSSGSSADPKLTSAMKSPIQTHRPARKRVSLALGDTIVAPSDSVPEGQSHFSTSSHSRTRSLSADQDPSETELLQTALESEHNPETTPFPSLYPTPSTDKSPSHNPLADLKLLSPIKSPSKPKPRPPRPAPPPPLIDPDGDLFDLEESEDPRPSLPDLESEDEISGRLSPLPQPPLSTSPPTNTNPTDNNPTPSSPLSSPSSSSPSSSALQIDSQPLAARQPTKPGFRRPSATSDPIYAGQKYRRAEMDAVVNDVYGSSYARPSSKGSFTAGSLGESYMARNAEKLLRERPGRTGG